MSKPLKRSLNWLGSVWHALWNIVAGIFDAIAGLFGYRGGVAKTSHENIVPDDVDNALTEARADLNIASDPSPEPQLDAALDLIWHFVNAPATDRPWINLELLSEKQRTWLLGLSDGEVARLAAAGRVETTEAALLGKTISRETRCARRQRDQIKTELEVNTPVSKAQQVREQIALRVVRGIPIGNISAWKAAGADDPTPLETPDAFGFHP